MTLFISLSFSGFSQEKYATAKSDDRFVSANKNGAYDFVLPAGITQKDVAVSAEFYTMYFKVNFLEDAHIASIVLNEKDEKNKHVMVRFFVSLGIREIMYDGKTYAVEDFYQKFLKV